MADISQELQDQIEKAFNHRGHVTVTFEDGNAVEGFLFNRQISAGYVEMFKKNGDEKLRFEISDIRAIELTGKDHAESYDQYLNRSDQTSETSETS